MYLRFLKLLTLNYIVIGCFKSFSVVCYVQVVQVFPVVLGRPLGCSTVVSRLLQVVVNVSGCFKFFFCCPNVSWLFWSAFEAVCVGWFSLFLGVFGWKNCSCLSSCLGCFRSFLVSWIHNNCGTPTKRQRIWWWKQKVRACGAFLLNIFMAFSTVCPKESGCHGVHPGIGGRATKIPTPSKKIVITTHLSTIAHAYNEWMWVSYTWTCLATNWSEHNMSFPASSSLDARLRPASTRCHTNHNGRQLGTFQRVPHWMSLETHSCGCGSNLRALQQMPHETRQPRWLWSLSSLHSVKSSLRATKTENAESSDKGQTGASTEVRTRATQSVTITQVARHRGDSHVQSPPSRTNCLTPSHKARFRAT